MSKKMSTTGVGATIGQYVCFLSMIILLLSGMTVILSSCEKEVGEEIGETVTVRFSSREQGYGSEEAVTRGWDNGPRILETVDIPFEGGWTMSVDLVEEGLSRVRSVSDGLVPNAKVLVILYGSSDNYINSAVYTYNSSSTDLSGGNLQVSTGDTYRFVACSYNSATDVPAYSSTLTVSPAYDLLWGRTDFIPINAADQKIDLAVSHKLMKVKLTTSVPAGTSTVLSNMTASLTTNYNANLNVLTGAVSKGAATTAYSFTANDAGSNLTTPAATLNSDYGIAYTGGDNPFYVQIGSVTLQAGANSPVTQTGLSASFTTPLSTGRSYALQVNFKQGVPFAGSNIYWDNNLGQLMFKPTGYMGPENYYQGVYFKFGSLVGVSPARSASQGTGWSNTDIPVYGYNTNTSTWVKYTSVTAANGRIGITAASWDGIPCVTPLSAGSWTDNYIRGLGYDVNTGKGDICQLIGANNSALAGYHIPVSQDFGGSGTDNYSWGATSQGHNWYRNPPVSGGFYNFMSTYTGRDDGTTNLNTYGSGTNTAGSALLYNTIPFPASGPRNNFGQLNNVGSVGFYWSGSVNSINFGYILFFSSSSVGPSNNVGPYNALSVRCVKD